MRLRNVRGDGTEEEAGSESTQGDRNCGEVVAFAISSAEPGSGLSCAMAWPIQNASVRSESRPMMRTDHLCGVECAQCRGRRASWYLGPADAWALRDR